MTAMTQIQMDGLELGHEAAEAAANHAGKEWQTLANEIAMRYAKLNKRFTFEDIRIYAHTYHHLPLPPDNRAWGAIALYFIRQGLIRRVGQSHGKLRVCHGGPKTVWELKE